MRLPCPFCGERGNEEFYYLGDGTLTRPDGLDAAKDDMFEYVYIRGNPFGEHTELWYHQGGCRRWLRVTRDTRTHRVLKAEAASPALEGAAS